MPPMNAAEREQLWAQKARLRPMMARRREAQPDKPALGKRICAVVETLPEYRQAGTVCSYVGVGSEVLTWNLLLTAMTAGKRVLVPYVDTHRLALFHLHDPGELAPAPFGLLEPRLELRHRATRLVHSSDVDLFVVPGLAFDRTGARLGFGKGYYDALLHGARPDALRVGLAFACQILPRLPMLEYDIGMHVVITEDEVYDPRATERDDAAS